MSDIFFTCDVCGEQNDSPLAHACRPTALLRLIQERSAERDRLKRELEEAKALIRENITTIAGLSEEVGRLKGRHGIDVCTSRELAERLKEARRDFEAERSKADEFQKKFEIAREVAIDAFERGYLYRMGEDRAISIQGVPMFPRGGMVMEIDFLISRRRKEDATGRKG